MMRRIFLDSELAAPTTVGFVQARLDEIRAIPEFDDNTELSQFYDANWLRERLCVEVPVSLASLTVDDLLADRSTTAMDEIVRRAKVAEEKDKVAEGAEEKKA